MKTVITSGVGFISSHLAKELLTKGREAVVVSDFSRLGAENLSENDEYFSSTLFYRTRDFYESGTDEAKNA